MISIRPVQFNDVEKLYKYLSEPQILKYSRLKPNNICEMQEMILNLLEDEKNQKVISRVIINDDNNPIGMITLWDYCSINKEGFLATWLGSDFWGKGYNQIVKDLFFHEVFTKFHLNKIYLLVREYNYRSIIACKKIQYIEMINVEKDIELRNLYFEKIKNDHLIFSVDKETYFKYTQDK